MVHTFRAFLEFCYLARRNVLNESALNELTNALDQFHRYRTIFQTTGVRDDFSLPRQHALTHYAHVIWQFSAPNGLCSSITESKHIKAVKEPYRRTNKYNALGQVIIINERIDKINTTRVVFARRGMLNGTCLSDAVCIAGAYSFIFNFELEKTYSMYCCCTKVGGISVLILRLSGQPWMDQIAEILTMERYLGQDYKPEFTWQKERVSWQ
jgi:hypothetical protein